MHQIIRDIFMSDLGVHVDLMLDVSFLNVTLSWNIKTHTLRMYQSLLEGILPLSTLWDKVGQNTDFAKSYYISFINKQTKQTNLYLGLY